MSTFRDGESTTSLAAHPKPHHSFWEQMFPTVQPTPPLPQLKAVAFSSFQAGWSALKLLCSGDKWLHLGRLPSHGTRTSCCWCIWLGSWWSALRCPAVASCSAMLDVWLFLLLAFRVVSQECEREYFSDSVHWKAVFSKYSFSVLWNTLCACCLQCGYNKHCDQVQKGIWAVIKFPNYFVCHSCLLLY